MTRRSLGARWRALLRFTLGKPGALPRWMAGSLVAFIVTGFVVQQTGWYPLLLVILVPILWWLPLRANLEGDEDELNAEYPAKVIEAIRQRTVSPDELEDYFAKPEPVRGQGVVDWPDIPADFPSTPLEPMTEHADESPEWTNGDNSDA